MFKHMAPKNLIFRLALPNLIRLNECLSKLSNALSFHLVKFVNKGFGANVVLQGAGRNKSNHGLSRTYIQLLYLEIIPVFYTFFSWMKKV